MEGSEVSLSIKILDPQGKEIITNSVVTNSFEDYFDITEPGIHTLVIDTTNEMAVNVVGGIGHVPDASAYSISMIGFALLLIGMLGVVIVGIILIRQRKKTNVS